VINREITVIFHQNSCLMEWSVSSMTFGRLELSFMKLFLAVSLGTYHVAALLPTCRHSSPTKKSNSQKTLEFQRKWSIFSLDAWKLTQPTDSHGKMFYNTLCLTQMLKTSDKNTTMKKRFLMKKQCLLNSMVLKGRQNLPLLSLNDFNIPFSLFYNFLFIKKSFILKSIKSRKN